MNIQEIQPINFLFFRTETTLAELAKFFPVAKDLFREAVQHDLHITGPIHWHYLGFNGDASKSFTLEISLPVSDVVPNYDGPFHFKRTEPFHCVSILHTGAWNEIPGSYAKVMQFMAEHKLTPGPVTRELYVNADFHNPEANLTLIQMGVNEK